MLDLVIVALQKLLGPLVHAAFEWPKTSTGWKILQQMTRLCALLPVQCDFDGCRFDTRDAKGNLLKKPWRVQTDLVTLQQPLSQRCDQNHFHSQCRGESALASGSAKFAKKIVPYLFRSTFEVYPADWEYPEDDETDVAEDADFGQEEEEVQQHNLQNLQQNLEKQQRMLTKILKSKVALDFVPNFLQMRLCCRMLCGIFIGILDILNQEHWPELSDSQVAQMQPLKLRWPIDVLFAIGYKNLDRQQQQNLDVGDTSEMRLRLISFSLLTVKDTPEIS